MSYRNLATSSKPFRCKWQCIRNWLHSLRPVWCKWQCFDHSEDNVALDSREEDAARLPCGDVTSKPVWPWTLAKMTLHDCRADYFLLHARYAERSLAVMKACSSESWP